MTGKNARISVTDDGPGIPAGDRERALGRFSRLEADRSRDSDDEGGSGLGPPGHRAGHRQAHGGSAWLEDAGPGLRAVVLLPAAAVSRPASSAPTKPPRAAAP